MLVDAVGDSDFESVGFSVSVGDKECVGVRDSVMER